MSQWDKAQSAANKLAQDDINLLLRKAADYSTDNVHAVGEEGLASRLVDKVYRLRNLLSSGQNPQVKGESIEDTLSDIRNYSTMLSLKRHGLWPRMIRSVYLAGPIDDSGEDSSDTIVIRSMQDRGLTVYSPRDAFCGAHASPDFVARVNRSAINECDAMFVLWPNPVPSLGTGRDVEFAKMRGKRVLVFAPWCTSTELHDCEVYLTITDALQAMAP